MAGKEQTPVCETGIIGLGVMGRNLLLNMADHGFAVAGLDKDPSKTESLENEAAGRKIFTTRDIREFTRVLRTPRAILLLVPAGQAVDSVIDEMMAYLQPGDIIIDGGNSWFRDTERRAEALQCKEIRFVGMGVSGGEEGARHGPSLMPGGPRNAYERMKPVLEAIAASAGGEPCVAWVGAGPAGHFVKMVHNGIEYGLMQLIAETYDLMKRGLGLSNEAISSIFGRWNEGPLTGYLVEITSKIMTRTDDRTGKDLVDVIRGVARQKGTGMWTSQSAMDLQIPVPVIDMAVSMRDLSMADEERTRAAVVMGRPVKPLTEDPEKFPEVLEQALFSAMILAYAQGFALLAAASAKYDYKTDLSVVAGIWRGGCIIRSAFLETARKTFLKTPGIPNILQDPEIAALVMPGAENLRQVICRAISSGIPVPALMASLGYLDSYRSEWLPANLIQAQRDFFGSHTYERIDAAGTFHTIWEGR